MSDNLDPFLPFGLRQEIEQRYYAPVNRHSRLGHLRHDPVFWAELERHVALFSDHGVVHVRDVAQQIVRVLTAAHGLLIPERGAESFTRMQAMGVLLAYWHDVGMADFSRFGRKMHPERASQLIFAPEMDGWLDQVWAADRGRVATHLTFLAQQGGLTVSPQVILREILALALAHSKSKIPTAILNDPAQLRAKVLAAAATDLRHLFDPTHPPGPPNPYLPRFYDDFTRQGFGWLIQPHPALQELHQDVIDTLRALRCADALRQRGTVLKTSGGYEIFLDSTTAQAIFALRLEDTHLFLLESSDPISAGEANIAGSELAPAGDVRISLHRGRFASPSTTVYAAQCTARVIQDIQADTIDSFERIDGAPGLKAAAAMLILLEETDDNLSFAEQVRDELGRLDSAAAARLRIVPSLHRCSEAERTLYLTSEPVSWHEAEKRQLLARMQQSGHPTAAIHPDHAFQHVHLVTLTPGQTLIAAGAPAGFVYIPLGPGLKIAPLGGYATFSVAAWMPLGVTGVIRGDVRNADVIAEVDVAVLMIPRSVYLKQWHATHTFDSLRQVLLSDRSKLT